MSEMIINHSDKFTCHMKGLLCVSKSERKVKEFSGNYEAKKGSIWFGDVWGPKARKKDRS